MIGQQNKSKEFCSDWSFNAGFLICKEGYDDVNICQKGFDPKMCPTQKYFRQTYID